MMVGFTSIAVVVFSAGCPSFQPLAGAPSGATDARAICTNLGRSGSDVDQAIIELTNDKNNGDTKADALGSIDCQGDTNCESCANAIINEVYNQSSTGGAPSTTTGSLDARTICINLGWTDIDDYISDMTDEKNNGATRADASAEYVQQCQGDLDCETCVNAIIDELY